MTSDKEVKELLADGWEMTDKSCNQMRKAIVEDEAYMFREDRIINPITKETEVYESELFYDSLDWFELVNACEAFGYTAEQVSKWIDSGDEIPLMLECVFELEN